MRLYFQPYNNAEDKPVIKVRLASIKRIFQVKISPLLCLPWQKTRISKRGIIVFQRRYLLRPLGLEIEYTESKSGRTEHIYLTFSKPEVMKSRLSTNLTRAAQYQYSGA